MFDDDLERLDNEDALPQPYWTLRRVVYILIILITLIAFIVYILSPLFFPPVPVLPVPPPRNQV